MKVGKTAKQTQILEIRLQQLSSALFLHKESCESTPRWSKNKAPFEDGEIIYNLVVLVGGKHLRADRNLHRKIGKNSTCNRNQLKCLTFQSCCFVHRTQNHTKSVLLEGKRYKLSIDAKYDQIQAREDL